MKSEAANAVENGRQRQETAKNAITYFEDFMILFPDDTSIADAAAGLSDMKTMMAESRALKRIGANRAGIRI